MVAGAPSRWPPADGCHHRQVVASVVVAALTVSCALLTAVVWLTGLSRVPEPVDGDDSEVKVPYAALARPRIASLVAVFSGVASWIAATHVPTAALPPWLVMSTLGVALAAVDGFTTWIPAGPTRWTWLVMAAAGAGTLLAGASWTDLLRMVVGGVVAGLLYLVLWVLTRGGFGFGDVRFVPLVAAPAAAVSVDVLLAALLTGTVLAGARCVASRDPPVGVAAVGADAHPWRLHRRGRHGLT